MSEESRISNRLESIEYRLGRMTQMLVEGLQLERSILERMDTVADTITDVDAILATVDTDLAALQASNAALITYLQSIEPGSPAPDFTPEVTKLQALDAALQALTTSDTAAVPANPPVTAPPTDPTAPTS